MTNDDTAVLLAQLDALLDAERAALMNGELSELGDVLAEKEQLIDRLSELDRAELESLGTLKEKAMRNQEIMDNAMRGIRSVASRLAALRKIRRTLETYDSTGRKQTIQTQGGQVEKRA